MLKVRLNLRKVATIAACLTVTTMFSGCDDKEKQREIQVENETALTQTVFADETDGASGVTIVTSGAWSSSITEGSVKSTKAGTPSWVSIAPDHGDAAGTYTIVISLEPNATGEDRAATITITCNGETITITVTQKGIKEDGEPYVDPEKSSECSILSFIVNGVYWTINSSNLTVTHLYSQGTDLSNLTPDIVCSERATISPASGVAQDFSDGKMVTYTVTAEDGTMRAYVSKADVETTTLPAPVITGFSPPYGAQHGDILTITGDNFSDIPSENSVTLNDITAEVISASKTEIKVIVPKNRNFYGKIHVTVGGATAESADDFNYLLTVTVSSWGNGMAGFADGNISSAQFNNPCGIAIDLQDNVYVADRNNHCIRKVTPTGVVSTLAGSGMAGFADGNGAEAQFNNPCGIAVDPQGNVYVADRNNHSIRRVTPAGVVSTLAGNGMAGFADGNGSEAQFGNPCDIAIDFSGAVFVADQSNHLIRRIFRGTVSTVAGKGGQAGFIDGAVNSALFNNPAGIAIDASDAVFVADAGNHCIRRINEGIVSTVTGKGGQAGFQDGDQALFNNPCGLVISGSLYVADANNHRIREFHSEGYVTTLTGYLPGFTDGDVSVAEFNQPHSIAVDGSGYLYIADSMNHRIRKIVFE